MYSCVCIFKWNYDLVWGFILNRSVHQILGISYAHQFESMLRGCLHQEPIASELGRVLHARNSSLRRRKATASHACQRAIRDSIKLLLVLLSRLVIFAEATSLFRSLSLKTLLEYVGHRFLPTRLKPAPPTTSWRKCLARTILCEIAMPEYDLKNKNRSGELPKLRVFFLIAL